MLKLLLTRIQAKEIGKRVFVKDMAKYIRRNTRGPSPLASSLLENKRNNDETPHAAENPTCIPTEYLREFHFTFLIRHPRYTVPSYYKLTKSQLIGQTWNDIESFHIPDNYRYLRRTLDFLRTIGHIGMGITGQCERSEKEKDNITVVDASDLLDDPEGVLSLYCSEVGIPFNKSMLSWDTNEAREKAQKQFGIWEGWHDVVLASGTLEPRTSTQVCCVLGPFPVMAAQRLIQDPLLREEQSLKRKRTLNGPPCLARKRRNKYENVLMHLWKTMNISNHFQ
jgi:Sulfotransferase domain